MMSVTARLFLLTIVPIISACGGGSGDSSISGTSADAVSAMAKISLVSSEKQISAATKIDLVKRMQTALQAYGTSVVLVGGTDTTAIKGVQRVAELAAVPWSSLSPGALVIVYPGSYAGPVTIIANGSAASPIRVEPADPAQLPFVHNSIDIRGSSYVFVTGLHVQSPTWGGFVIRQGSRQITLDRNVIRNAPIGIDITDGASTGLVVTSNLIEDANTNGISISTNGTAAERNLIARNTLRRSGHHGVELRGSFWRVENNDVSYSGRSISGTSGIHIYSEDPNENSGDDNIVKYNYSYANSDTGASDGNGIQLDHWSDRNVVAFNLIWGNDGSGINIFESTDNIVHSNTVLANNIDPNGTHGALGEIVLGARLQNNRTAGNRVFNNIAAAGRANVPAIYVDGRSYLNSNEVGPNLTYNAAGGTAFRWSDAVLLKDAASIDAATGTMGNLVEVPAFANYDDPFKSGLKLVKAPSARGVELPGEKDFTGSSSSATSYNFGAYFY